jgi:hypothetical protein
MRSDRTAIHMRWRTENLRWRLLPDPPFSAGGDRPRRLQMLILSVVVTLMLLALFGR